MTGYVSGSCAAARLCESNSDIWLVANYVLRCGNLMRKRSTAVCGNFSQANFLLVIIAIPTYFNGFYILVFLLITVEPDMLGLLS